MRPRGRGRSKRSGLWTPPAPSCRRRRRRPWRTTTADSIAAVFSAPFARQQVIFGGIRRLTASEHHDAQRNGPPNKQHGATEQLLEIRMTADASCHTIRLRESDGAESNRRATKGSGSHVIGASHSSPYGRRSPANVESTGRAIAKQQTRIRSRAQITPTPPAKRSAAAGPWSAPRTRGGAPRC